MPEALSVTQAETACSARLKVREAIDEARPVNLRIELIDGKRLAELMLRHGVGAQPKTSATLYDLDEDFFEEL